MLNTGKIYCFLLDSIRTDSIKALILIVMDTLYCNGMSGMLKNLIIDECLQVPHKNLQ